MTTNFTALIATAERELYSSSAILDVDVQYARSRLRFICLVYGKALIEALEAARKDLKCWIDIFPKVEDTEKWDMAGTVHVYSRISNLLDMIEREAGEKARSK